jgi:cellulose biosynthesis protein BcsQ
MLVFLHGPLFAVDSPQLDTFGPLWTTNQVLYLVAGILVPALGGLLFCLRMFHAHCKDAVARSETDHKEKAGELQGRIGSLEKERDQLKQDLSKGKASGDDRGAAPIEKLVQVSVELAKAQDEVVELNGLVAEVSDKNATLEQRMSSLTKKLEESLANASVELKTYEDLVGQNERRVMKALKTEGQFWSVKALHTTPKFRPPQLRRRAIVSVCNLKGGVGKTTVTAHLGASLVRKGYRVLLVDLDLQGSLTSLFLPQDSINERFRSGGLLQHFFQDAASDVTKKILDYTAPILDGKAGLVATTDQLAYAELAITLKWLLMSGRRDTRFLLRKALHLMEVTNEYDVTLLDCPPLLNISCINALAASDYVLVPVLPSQKAAERVPILLKRLREERFRKNVNPDLKVLGLVANRTWGDTLTANEELLWSNMQKWAGDAWTEAVPTCKTLVPRNQSIPECEQAGALIEAADGRLRGVFDRLASEVEERLPHECRRPTEVPA